MNLIRNDDGAALLSVLLLVSVMSATMVASFELLGFFTRFTAAQSLSYQAREYTLAAEIVGAEQAVNLAQNSELAAKSETMSSENKVNFQIDGGSISGELIEYSNCFNLSSLVSMNGANNYDVNNLAYDQYVRLLESLGIGKRQAIALASSLVDWQDSDDRPLTLGAESLSYTQAEIPYHSANQPISQIDELRLVKGYTVELIEVLKPISCVDPISMETVININTVDSLHVPVVHALLGIPVSLQDITLIIENRPASGFDHISRFWSHPIIEDREISSQIRKQFSISPQRYKLIVDVNYGDITVHQESLFTINNDNSYTLITREFGI